MNNLDTFPDERSRIRLHSTQTAFAEISFARSSTIANLVIFVGGEEDFKCRDVY